MKLFVAESRPIGRISDTAYHWTYNGEILMFQTFKGDPNKNISMCGIRSQKFTTFIQVKELDVSPEFVYELMTEAVEKSKQCVVEDDGKYTVGLGEGWDMTFNLKVQFMELVMLAAKFEDGQQVALKDGKIIKVSAKS